MHPELAVALDVSDEQPVTWFSRLDDDNTLSAALLDFFNTMNEDGSLARLEEKYLGMAMILTMLIPAPFTRRRQRVAGPRRCLRNMRKR